MGDTRANGDDSFRCLPCAAGSNESANQLEDSIDVHLFRVAGIDDKRASKRSCATPSNLSAYAFDCAASFTSIWYVKLSLYMQSYKLSQQRCLTSLRSTPPCSVPISFLLRRCTMRDLRRGRETVRATINGGKVPLTAAEKKKRNPFGATRKRGEREKEGRKFVCRQFFFFSFFSLRVDGHLLHSHRQQKSVTTATAAAANSGRERQRTAESSSACSLLSQTLSRLDEFRAF